MPNWCDTHYTLRGPKSDLEAIEKELNEMENNEPRTPNGFGRLWLGELVDRLGGNSNECRCRGEVISWEYNAMGDLTITQETAWCEQEGVRHTIERKFPDVKVFYLAEECGNGIYVTNDVDEECYGEEYNVEICNGDDSYSRYYGCLEEVAEAISECGYEGGADYDEISKFISEYNDRKENEEQGAFIYFVELKRIAC